MKIREKKYSILLLTNRDSDNVGDQVIEACDIALIKTAVKNLGLDSECGVNSYAVSAIGKKYLNTKNEFLIKTGNELNASKVNQVVQNTDLIVFGGAPLFNFQYQMFYEKTAFILELAQKYHKPVVFSAIGIEHYEEDNPKCQRLKKTLNFDCVKQITTRDGIELLRKYKSNDNMVIARVSDPAVFSAEIFRNFVKQRKGYKKTVGIFVFRANGFTDNKIDFSREDAVELWKDMIEGLTQNGYDYRLLTSGHFGDEAFLDYLVLEHAVDEKKCIFDMDTPEKLIESISSFDAIVSCRLHPSIIAYSLNVPSLGLVWNPKVKYFYDCINYSDRCMEVKKNTAQEVVEKINEIVGENIVKEKSYLMSVYCYLFEGIKIALDLENDSPSVYSYEELLKNIPANTGASRRERRKKLERKLRRMYRTLNERAKINAQLKEELKRCKNTSDMIELSYHSGAKGEKVYALDGWDRIVSGRMKRLASKALECKVSSRVENDGTQYFAEAIYSHAEKDFEGWRLRFLIGAYWFWYLENGTFARKDQYDGKENIKIFFPGEVVPMIPLAAVQSVVAEAKWKNK